MSNTWIKNIVKKFTSKCLKLVTYSVFNTKWLIKLYHVKLKLKISHFGTSTFQFLFSIINPISIVLMIYTFPVYKTRIEFKY